jgi:hypothetical protein
VIWCPVWWSYYLYFFVAIGFGFFSALLFLCASYDFFVGFLFF